MRTRVSHCHLQQTEMEVTSLLCIRCTTTSAVNVDMAHGLSPRAVTMVQFHCMTASFQNALPSTDSSALSHYATFRATWLGRADNCMIPHNTIVCGKCVPATMHCRGAFPSSVFEAPNLFTTIDDFARDRQAKFSLGF
jgi:hypothetical protein